MMVLNHQRWKICSQILLRKTDELHSSHSLCRAHYSKPRWFCNPLTSSRTSRTSANTLVHGVLTDSRHARKRERLRRLLWFTLHVTANLRTSNDNYSQLPFMSGGCRFHQQPEDATRHSDKGHQHKANPYLHISLRDQLRGSPSFLPTGYPRENKWCSDYALHL